VVRQQYTNQESLEDLKCLKENTKIFKLEVRVKITGSSRFFYACYLSVFRITSMRGASRKAPTTNKGLNRTAQGRVTAVRKNTELMYRPKLVNRELGGTYILNFYGKGIQRDTKNGRQTYVGFTERVRKIRVCKKLGDS